MTLKLILEINDSLKPEERARAIGQALRKTANMFKTNLTVFVGDGNSIENNEKMIGYWVLNRTNLK